VGDTSSIAAWLVELRVAAEYFGAILGRKIARLDNVLGAKGDAKKRMQLSTCQTIASHLVCCSGCRNERVRDSKVCPSTNH
jgi:hypothetical protein